MFFTLEFVLKFGELRDSTTDVRYLPPEYLVKYRQRSVYEATVKTLTFYVILKILDWQMQLDIILQISACITFTLKRLQIESLFKPVGSQQSHMRSFLLQFGSSGT